MFFKTKILPIITAFSLISVLVIPISNAASDPEKKIDESLRKAVVAKSEQTENEIFAENAKKAKQEIEKATREIKDKDAQENQQATRDINDKYALQKKINEISDKYYEISRKEILDRKSKDGWVVVSQPNSGLTLTPASTSDKLVLSDDALLYNSSTGLYQFSSNFNFIDIDGWDQYGDIYDIMSVRANNPISIYSSYAKTYEVKGTYGGGYYNQIDYSETETGYDNNGTVASGSRVTKRFENGNGVVWNINDGGGDTWAPDNYVWSEWHSTDYGRATVYIDKARSSATNKIFLDYEHNWKTYSVSGSATFNTVSLTGPSLSVSYNKVNSHYLRTSTGKSY